ncbi:hypothetical protein XBI1_1870141 [Xenorhabdus bovienii str. Intermedium]|uniref:Uncharacterized protein n=1 Tax=Xenorhabdus bovienii str. Intermedium TaxID=1379677 RepID=A0A077QGJ0_XENBV|nr:hypothetical protein XBI1_1870141 [Xenorhabdus bovienii str. Intermedium]
MINFSDQGVLTFCEGNLNSMMIWYNQFRQKLIKPHHHATNYVNSYR